MHWYLQIWPSYRLIFRNARLRVGGDGRIDKKGATTRITMYVSTSSCGWTHDGHARESRNRVAQFALMVSLDADSLDPDCVQQTRGYYQMSIKLYARAFVLIHSRGIDPFVASHAQRTIVFNVCPDRSMCRPFSMFSYESLATTAILVSTGFYQSEKREESSVTIFRVLQC